MRRVCDIFQCWCALLSLWCTPVRHLLSLSYLWKRLAPNSMPLQYGILLILNAGGPICYVSFHPSPNIYKGTNAPVVFFATLLAPKFV